MEVAKSALDLATPLSGLVRMVDVARVLIVPNQQTWERLEPTEERKAGSWMTAKMWLELTHGFGKAALPCMQSSFKAGNFLVKPMESLPNFGTLKELDE